MKRFAYSLFAACLSLGMGLSAAVGNANAAQSSLMATPSAQTSAPNIQNVQYYDYRGDRRYWRNIVVTGDITVRVIARTIAMIAVIGDRHLSAATVRRRSIAVATPCTLVLQPLSVIPRL